MTSGISDSLRPYLPTSLFQADGNLKAGVTPEQATAVAKGIQAKAEALPPAQAKLFLAMVGSASLAPDGKLPADFDKAIESFTAAASRLATLSISSNALDFLARAMIEQSAEQRKSALNDRLQARELAKGELLSQAGKMQEEANKLSSSALTSMIVSVTLAAISAATSVVSMGLSIGGALKGASAAAKATAAFDKAGQSVGDATQKATAGVTKAASTATKALDKIDDTVSEATSKTVRAFERMQVGQKAQEASTGAKVMNTLGGGLGSLGQLQNQTGQGVGSYIATTGQADAKRLEAEGSVDAAQAQEQQAIGDLRKEQQQALDQMVQSIIQFLKDLKEAKAEQMRAFTRV